MKVFIHSCHATLEYDQALMFTGMGCAVAGNFDVGSVQRPKIVGVTDVSSPIEAGIEEADVYVLHQVEDYANVFEKIASIRGNKPTILTQFGQGCLAQHSQVVGTANRIKGAHITSYSKTDYKRTWDLGCAKEKCSFIRFGKNLKDYGQAAWTGVIPGVYISCNSIQRRGMGCGWRFIPELRLSNVPLLLSGKETDTVGGIGEQSPEALINLYKTFRCFMSLGTVPAPYVLTTVEAMCSGAPVIVYDNGCGIVDEGLDVLVAHSMVEANMLIKSLCTDMDAARRASLMSLACALREFDMNKVASDWDRVLEDML